MPFMMWRKPRSGALPGITTLMFSVALVFAIAGCTQKMADQPRYDPLQRSDFFRDTLSARPLPAGVIPITFVDNDSVFQTGMKDGKPAQDFPVPLTRVLLDRGHQRYNIFCSPCHDFIGTGHGMAARRGFRRQPSDFQTDDMRASPPGHFFDVMTNGFGAMPSYSKQVGVSDRWAIIAYIRALQLSQDATINDVPTNERQRLEAEKR